MLSIYEIMEYRGYKLALEEIKNLAKNLNCQEIVQFCDEQIKKIEYILKADELEKFRRKMQEHTIMSI